MICCDKEMIYVLGFASFAPSSSCDMCFGSGDFYLGDGQIDYGGCGCVKGVGPKERYLKCAECLFQISVRVA